MTGITAIAVSGSLTSINLAVTNLGPAGAKALVEGGAFRSSLTSIDLGSNDLLAEGAEALVEGGAFSGSVMSMNLMYNSLDKETQVLLRHSAGDGFHLIL